MTVSFNHLEVVDDLALVPDMVAGGNYVDVEFEQLFSERRCNSKPGRRIFPIGNPFDVTADGKKFLLMMPPPGSQSPMTLVTNWTSALEKK